MNQPGCLAKPYTGVLGVALCEGFSIARTFYRDVLFQLILPPVPSVGEGVTANTSCKSPGPWNLAGNVRNAGADSPITIRLDDGLVVSRMDEGLL
jgi:hypothetical protein